MKQKPYHHLAICPCCQGTGLSSAWLGEVSNMCEEDPEFEEAYFAGEYDRPCGECEGMGRIYVLDSDAPSELLQQEQERLEMQQYEADAWRLRCAEDGIRHW